MSHTGGFISSSACKFSTLFLIKQEEWREKCKKWRKKRAIDGHIKVNEVSEGRRKRDTKTDMLCVLNKIFNRIVGL